MEQYAENIHELIEKQVKKYGDRPFMLGEPGEPLDESLDEPAESGKEAKTYAEFANASFRCANVLKKYHAKKGDVLCTLIGAVPGTAAVPGTMSCWPVIFFGTGALGMVNAPLNAALSSRELLSILESLKPAHLLIDEQNYEKIKKAVPGLGIRNLFGKGFYEDGVIDFDAEFDDAATRFVPLEPVHESDTALICFSSGSSGTPRAIPQTNRWLIEQSLLLIDFFGISDKDVILCLRNAHSVEFVLSALTAFIAGAGFVYNKTFSPPFSPEGFFARLSAAGVSVVFGMPAHLSMLLATHQQPVSKLLFLSSGYQLPLKTRQACSAGYPSMAICDCYFSAETGFIALESRGRGKLGSVGKVLPHIGYRIVDEQGAEKKPFESGELVITSDPYLMKGYLNAPLENRMKMRKDGFHTGDICSADNDDYLFIRGRKRALIVTGTEQVSPKEVDDVLQQHKNVQDAATIGIPGRAAGDGEEVVSFVVIRYGTHATERDLLEHCREQLAAYKCPSRIVFVEKIQRDRQGKPDREALLTCLEGVNSRPKNIAVEGTEVMY